MMHHGHCAHFGEALGAAESQLPLVVTTADVELAVYGQRCAVAPPSHDLDDILCCDNRDKKKKNTKIKHEARARSHMFFNTLVRYNILV